MGYPQGPAAENVAWQATSPQANAIKADSLSDISSDLGSNVERLIKLHCALCGVSERLMGAGQTATAPVEPPDTPASSIIHNLRRKNNAINNLIARCEEEAQRIEQALGLSG